MTDRIRIDGLLVRAVVGVHDWERTAPRDVRLDVVVETDVSRAGTTDELSETVDYDILAQRVHERVAAASPKLIETVAEVAAKVCLEHRRVLAAEITVHKPHAIDLAQSVSVTIRRVRG